MATHHTYFDSDPSVVGAFQEFGLATKTRETATGLTASSYSFKVNGTEYIITLPASTKFIDLLQALNAIVQATDPNIRFTMVNGDVRCIQKKNGTLLLAAGVTGTNLFGVGGLSCTLDAAVPNIMYIEKHFSGKVGTLEQVAINFPIFYTGDILWEIVKNRSESYNLTFTATIAAASTYFTSALNTHIQLNDTIVFITQLACAGTSYLEYTAEWNGD
jgi:hypothetical protein